MAKRLVICSDGTWDKPGESYPSNVVKMARAIAPTTPDGTSQVVFYDQGVGTEGGIWENILGGAIGKGLDKNVEDGYRFLIHNYSDADDIFLFGFSRGAFTVRSLAGLIRNSGLLNKLHADKVDDALDLYRGRGNHPDAEAPRKFRESYSREVKIKFIGVWDTVEALGIRGALGMSKGGWPGARLLFSRKHRSRYAFHDAELSGSVEHGYHALAIDEKRKPFRPTLWNNPPKDGQTIEQVWFTGVHSDIGGGYLDRGLSDVAFDWMREKAEGCGLAFDRKFLDTAINPDPLATLHRSMNPVYRLLGSFVRSIGRSHGDTEAVHQAVMDRLEHARSAYSPGNVVDYIRRQPHRD